MNDTRVSMDMDSRKVIFEAPSRRARLPSGLRLVAYASESAQPRALAGRFEQMRPKAGGVSHVGRGARPTAPEGGRAPRDHLVAPGNLFDKSPKANAYRSHRCFSREQQKWILCLLTLLMIALALPASGQGVRTMLASEHPPGGFYVHVDGKISSISVEKTTQSGSEIVYSQTSDGNPEAPLEAKTDSGPVRLALLEQHPTDPAPGEMYLNTSAGHFYGWNGKEWRQLDNASGGRFIK